MKMCEQCKVAEADGYGMGPRAGDWGGWYCTECANRLGYPLTDKIKK